jgi:hypothetical protein
MSTEFITEAEAMKVAQRDVPNTSTIRLLDSAEVGNDEGMDVLVLVVEVSHEGLPELGIKPYVDGRFYVFKRGADHAAFSGNI